MIGEEGLESRVHMVGPVPHEKARDLLVSTWCIPPCSLAPTIKAGHIGLFCITACCYCYVLSLQ